MRASKVVKEAAQYVPMVIKSRPMQIPGITSHLGKMEYLLRDQPKESYLQFSKNYFAEDDATSLMVELKQQVPWEWSTYKLDGKDVKAPRRMAWYADDPSWTYHFSKNHQPGLKANSWNPVLLYIKNCVEQTLGTTYNACLVNLYMNSLEHAYWHSDDDPWLGYPDPCIVASVSLGHTRIFGVRPKIDVSKEMEFELTHGSLCAMGGRFQEHYQHAVPPMERKLQEGYRINLTFRNVKDPSKGPEKEFWGS